MLPLRFRWFWLGFGLFSLTLILALALAPLSGPLPVLTNDKVAHFVGFVYLTCWFLGMARRDLAWRIMLALAAYGVLIEVLQGLTPYRAVEAADVVSDLAGIGTGWLLSSTVLKGWCGRVESLLGAAAP
jgi:VanZ family protein